MIRVLLLFVLIRNYSFADQSVFHSAWQRISGVCFGGEQTKDNVDFEGEKGKFSSLSSVQIAVVNIKEVASKCKAGCKINEQLQKINDAAKARLLPLEERVKKESEKLRNDALRVEEMQAALYDTVKTERYQISDAADLAIEKLRAEMKKAIATLAKQRGVVVLDSEAALSLENIVDITEDVIAELDSICPYIEIKLESVKR